MSEQLPDGVTVIEIFSVPEIHALTVRDLFSVSLRLLSRLPVRWRLSRLRLRRRFLIRRRRGVTSLLGLVVFLDRNG